MKCQIKYSNGDIKSGRIVRKQGAHAYIVEFIDSWTVQNFATGNLETVTQLIEKRIPKKNIIIN